MFFVSGFDLDVLDLKVAEQVKAHTYDPKLNYQDGQIGMEIRFVITTCFCIKLAPPDQLLLLL